MGLLGKAGEIELELRFLKELDVPVPHAIRIGFGTHALGARCPRILLQQVLVELVHRTQSC